VDRLADIQQDGKRLDSLADVQTGWQTPVQAGRHTDSMENTWIGWQMFKQDGKQLDRQTGRRSDADRRLDCQADVQTGVRNPYRQDRKPLDRLVDIQTGLKTLGQAGRRSDRMANT
jgi:hypothetical protein